MLDQVYVVAISSLVFANTCLQYLFEGIKGLIRSVISKGRIVRPLEPFGPQEDPNTQ